MTTVPGHDPAPRRSRHEAAPLDTELGLYARDIGREPLLSPEEAGELAATIQAGAHAARQSAFRCPDVLRRLLRVERVAGIEEIGHRLDETERGWRAFRSGHLSAAGYHELLAGHGAALERQLNPGEVARVYALRDDLVARAAALGAELDRIIALTGESSTAAIREWEEAQLLTAPMARAIAAEIAAATEAAAPARDRLWRCNLRLVVPEAMRLRDRGLSLPELISHGNEGLHRAVELFDAERGVRFSSYATWWVRQAMLVGIERERGLVHIPAHVRRLLGELRRTMSTEVSAAGTVLTLDEAVERLGWGAEKQRVILGAPRLIASIDAPLGGDDSEVSLARFLASGEEVVEVVGEAEQRARVTRIVGRMLDERQRTVIAHRYGLSLPGVLPTGLAAGIPHSGEAIGPALGVSRQRAEQIRNEAEQVIRAAVYLDGMERTAVTAGARVLGMGERVLVEAALGDGAAIDPGLLANPAVLDHARRVRSTGERPADRVVHLAQGAIERLATQVAVDTLSPDEREAILGSLPGEAERFVFREVWLHPSGRLGDLTGHPGYDELGLPAGTAGEARLRRIRDWLTEGIIWPRINSAMQEWLGR